MMKTHGTLFSAELARQIADRIKRSRLQYGWTQAELAQRAGVALATLRVFEQTGRISLERLLRLAIALNRSAEFEQLLLPPSVASIDELLVAPPVRKRGRTR